MHGRSERVVRLLSHSLTSQRGTLAQQLAVASAEVKALKNLAATQEQYILSLEQGESDAEALACQRDAFGEQLREALAQCQAQEGFVSSLS